LLFTLSGVTGLYFVFLKKSTLELKNFFFSVSKWLGISEGGGFVGEERSMRLEAPSY
jgi:hypothetical protein